MNYLAAATAVVGLAGGFAFGVKVGRGESLEAELLRAADSYGRWVDRTEATMRNANCRVGERLLSEWTEEEHGFSSIAILFSVYDKKGEVGDRFNATAGRMNDLKRRLELWSCDEP